MQVHEFLVVASLSSIFFYRSVLGQESEVIARDSTVAKDGKVTVNLGDLVIEVKPPRGREDIVNSQPIYEHWENVDDITYWESIYGSMDDIPAFEDMPDILGETVELKYVNEWEEEDPNKKPTEISNKDQVEVSIKKSSYTNDDRTKTSATLPLRIKRDSFKNRNDRINSVHSMKKSRSHEKRERSDSKENEAVTEEAPKSNRSRKKKGRTLSLHQSRLGKSRFKSNPRSDYLLKQYGRKVLRPQKSGSGPSSIEGRTDYGITGASRSEKIDDSAINAVELVNSGIAKTSQVVTGTVVNIARPLAETKHDVIDLVHRATQIIALGSLNNAVADCRKEGVVGAVATNIDSGREVVGNSVLDTNSGIINADSDVSAGIRASRDGETKAGIETVVGSVVDNDAAVAEWNSKLAADEAVEKEIVVAEIKREIDEIVGNVTQTETPVLKSGVGVSSHVDGDVKVVPNTEKSVGSALQVNAKNGIHTSLNAEKPTGLKTDVNVGKSHKYDHVRRILGNHDLSWEGATFLENYRDRELNPGHRHYDKFDEKREYRRRFPDQTRRTKYSHDYYGIYGDSGIHPSLDAGIVANSNFGSISTGAVASRDSSVDIGTSSSKIHTDSGFPSNSDRRGGDLHAGTKSSLAVDSHQDIGGTGLRTHGGNRINGDFNENVDVRESEHIKEYGEYRRRCPGHQFHPNHRGLHNSGVHGNAEIHESLMDARVEPNTGFHRRGMSSGLHADSAIPNSLDYGLGLNSNVAANNLQASLDADSRLDIGRTKSKSSFGSYRLYERGEDIPTEYDDDDDEREYGRLPEGRYRDRHRDSGIRTASGIHNSLDTRVDINEGSADDINASAKSSQGPDSHLDIGTTMSAVNSLHRPDAINSADARIDTSHDAGLGINAGRRLHGGIKSPLDLDSHLDTGTRTNGASGVDRRSRFEVDFNGPDGELVEKIYGPNSIFERTGRNEPSYICDNCKRQLYSGTDSFCPNCGRQDGMFREGRFSSSGTIFHLDSSKKRRKRSVDPSEGIELYSKPTFGSTRDINLKANCSDEAFRQSPDCQGLDYNLKMPGDENTVPLGLVQTHLNRGYENALDMHDRAQSLVAGGLHPRNHTASMLLFMHNKVPDDLVKLNEESELTLFGTKLLQHKLAVDYNITPNNFLKFLDDHQFRVTGKRISRGADKRCNRNERFRSIDGSCNNVGHPTWGQSNKAFVRILPARYSDGIHGMPVSITGAQLPNPRDLSVSVYSRTSNFDPEFTLAVMQWGQVLAHDLGRNVIDQTTEGGIECCAANGMRNLPKNLQHHSCAPITISPRDKFYSMHRQRCMNFVRSMTIYREDYTLGPADQLNGVTSFLDCSPMYGSDKATLNELREFTGGRMKVEFRSGRWMLPTMTNQSEFCDIWTSDDVCYRTGDPRNNQNPQLVILQTMLVREHNRIADELGVRNARWNDERIFQESRRIVIAEYQHITYNEWLPLLVGTQYAKKHGLIRTAPGMSKAYSERINPSTILGFTSGAFRSLHSMIEGEIGLWNVKGDIINSLRLSNHYFRPRVIEKNNNFEELLRGLASQYMQSQDMNLHAEVTEFLYRSRSVYGMDLAAIDIQRGRDHGLPGYNAYRNICRLGHARDFDDLSPDISPENIERLRRCYAHVDDIDLVVGAIMENRAPGSKFGPTNRCLIAEQFYRSRVGDRYFYDNAEFAHSFTPQQYHEIRKITLARLICDTGGAVDAVQRDAFRTVSPKNPRVPCEHLPKLDLTLWVE